MTGGILQFSTSVFSTQIEPNLTKLSTITKQVKNLVAYATSQLVANFEPCRVSLVLPSLKIVVIIVVVVVVVVIVIIHVSLIASGNQ